MALFFTGPDNVHTHQCFEPSAVVRDSQMQQFVREWE
jgi:hypothetical protein